MPPHQSYTFPNDGTPYVSGDAVVGMGVMADLVSAAISHDALAAFCCLDTKGFLRRVKRPADDGLDFLTVPAAVRDMPKHRDMSCRLFPRTQFTGATGFG